MSAIKFSPYIPNVEAWTHYFEDQPKEYKKFYTIGRPKQKGEEMNPIKLVTPTQQVIEQARSQMKRQNETENEVQEVTKKRKIKRSVKKSSAKGKGKNKYKKMK